ncbi:MAG: family 20 glycosylhydrolase [Clostridium sp.]|uniref:family 20 glycosylhydrolase n=1 Tax=Clostridium sp. TaxID=1506 RepID=UPI003EE74711
MQRIKKILIITIFCIVGFGFIKVYAYEKPTINVIPKPNKCEVKGGKFSIIKSTKIYVQGKNSTQTEEIYNVAKLLKERMDKSIGYNIEIIKNEKPVGNYIYLTTIGGGIGLGNEGYTLESNENMVKILAYTPEGLFRGTKTLIQLLPNEIEGVDITKNIKWELPIVNIEDKPEYEYRGLMIDVARHFFPIDDIKEQIEFASEYKINKIHLHLSDDQGFRLEIKKWPKFTSIGGQTQVGGGIGGYYTQEHFKEIVNYAKDRYIEIIPEFDMPGHTNAMLASYEFLNSNGRRRNLYTGTEVGFSSLMCKSEATYSVIEDIIKEVSEISPSKYIHIGGDEADSTPKEEYNYFVERVSKIAMKYGKTPIGWDPIDTAPGINKNVILQNWKDSNEEAKNKKMKMIISKASNIYLDMKYNETTPIGNDWAGFISVEKAYNFDLTDFAPKELILGIEAPLWTETIKNKEEMEYMIYPRILGYSEIGWTSKENREWKEYKERLKTQGQRMSLRNINYYKSPEIWG